MEQRVRAASADMDLAGILHVNFGFPLFFVQNVYYSEKKEFQWQSLICTTAQTVTFILSKGIYNSLHKPPAPPVRIEKVLPLPGDHGLLIES